ncbi:MAG: CarD family transcriptional regulator [Bryobacteraceae bacterium]|jgi:CarD family transcriptional regulator
MTFQIGEKVVYPAQGIGTIENVSTRSFGAHFERFYLLRLGCGSMTVMVPFSHVSDVGLRKIGTNCEWARVLTFLSSGRCACCRNWKNRFKENSEKMRAGDPLQIAEVLKSLLLLQRQKPLSFREKKMLDSARQMLIVELSISRGMQQADAAGVVQRALAKAALELPPPR